MVWFGVRLPIDEDEFEWQLASFKWMLEEFEGIERHRQTQLVMPSTDFFPDSRLKGHARAEELFVQSRSLAGLDSVAFRLEAQEQDLPQLVHPAAGATHRSGVLGTYRIEHRGADAEPVISYNPALLDNPARLVATFAHELAHYVLDGARRVPPGGHDAHELVTDMVAVFLGFGIFLANGAKSFEGYQDHDRHGWQANWSGYLNEGALVTALAIAERLAGRDPMAAASWLKPHLAADLKRANSYLNKKHPNIEADVMAIDLDEFGVGPLD